ncbi:MAG: hypothetical protein DCC52_11910 [Chloroflexi bacterium]|nr:MAG: hypothetical protein DCC52_11910 [Chloroflexota bacterium]
MNKRARKSRHIARKIAAPNTWGLCGLDPDTLKRNAARSKRARGVFFRDIEMLAQAKFYLI